MQLAVIHGALDDAIATQPPIPLAASRGHVNHLGIDPQGD